MKSILFNLINGVKLRKLAYMTKYKFKGCFHTSEIYYCCLMFYKPSLFSSQTAWECASVKVNFVILESIYTLVLFLYRKKNTPYRPYGKYSLRFILSFIALAIFAFFPKVINLQIFFSLELDIYQQKDKMK